MRAELHGGPCDGEVDDNLAEPAPGIYACAKPEEGWLPPPGPVPDNRPAPTVPLVDHRYTLARVDGDTAHYEHMPGS
jgi:hypothetical protein